MSAAGHELPATPSPQTGRLKDSFTLKSARRTIPASRPNWTGGCYMPVTALGSASDVGERHVPIYMLRYFRHARTEPRTPSPRLSDENPMTRQNVLSSERFECLQRRR